MSEEQNCLTFSLTENVRFQKGQEVKELISISLEPNVTCHEFDQYVILQGTLDCVGEYSPVMLEDESEPDFYNVLKCARVTLNDNGKTYNFCHSFPVDITIPADRCRDGEELTVDIQSFEYKIQDEGCIDISCEFCVNGVYDRAFLENEKAEQNQPEQQIDSEVINSQFVSAETQYGYGQQEFQHGDQHSQFHPNLYQDDQVQYQDLVRQSPEIADQNQPFEQTDLDNTGYHPYYSHPHYGEQEWQRNIQSQWSDWERPSNVGEQVYQVPEQDYQVPREEYHTPVQEYQVPIQEYQVPAQEYPVPPIEEQETQASFYQTQEFQQPFFQASQHPWQPNQTFNTSKYQQPSDEADQLYQPFYQQIQAQQPVQFQQVEQQQFGDITNFRLNVHGHHDETGYKSIFHDELESPKGPAFHSLESPSFESVMSPPTFEKFESPESPKSFDAPVFENSTMDDDKPEEVEVFAEQTESPEVLGETSESPEQDRVDELEVFHAEVPSELDQSYDQVIYPFESEHESLNENEFYVEVKREPYEYETEYESEQEIEESPEYVEFKHEIQDKRDNQDIQTDNSSFVSNIFASREERSTCLKICIIQRGDSFEKLAQRYSIHPHKIARFNDLQPNAVLEEGSILYIPN